MPSVSPYRDGAFTAGEALCCSTFGMHCNSHLIDVLTRRQRALALGGQGTICPYPFRMRSYLKGTQRPTRSVLDGRASRMTFLLALFLLRVCFRCGGASAMQQVARLCRVQGR